MGAGVTWARPYARRRAAPRAALAPGEVRQGAVLRADFTCADSVSGVASCTGSTADGDALPTDTLGRHTFTVEARDVAGHVTRDTVTYRVVSAAAGAGDGSGSGSGSRDRLAVTGGDAATWLVPLGLVLVAGGVALTVTRRPARR